MAAITLALLLGFPAEGAAQGVAQGAVKRAASALEKAAQQKAREKELARYDPLFTKYSKRHFGVAFDWRIFKAQGMAESGLDPKAKSWVGARGIMQLMPTTFQAIQSRRPEFTSIDDPEWNIAAGIAHDRYLWRLFEKDVSDAERRRFMFASYNAGEGTIARARKVAASAQLDRSTWKDIEQVAPKVPRWRYRETVGYVKKIEGNIDRLRR